MRCPGSGQTPGRRHQSGLVVCGRCQALFRPYGLIYDTPRGNVALGIVPPHQMVQR
jgi:hypothetical protein